MKDQAILSAAKLSFSSSYVPKSLRGKIEVKVTRNGIELVAKKSAAKKQLLMSHNYNSSTTLEELSHSDLYDGIIIQSFGNTNCVYELNFIDGDIYYIIVARRENKNQPFVRVLSNVTSHITRDNKWCITTNSINFDKITQRNYKLIELGL